MPVSPTASKIWRDLETGAGVF